MQHSRKGYVVAAVFLAAVASLLFAELLFTEGIPFPAHTDAFRPWRNDLSPDRLSQVDRQINRTATDKNYALHPDNEVARESFGNGRIPLWNRYPMAGVPYLGQSLYGVFYPLNLPLFLFDRMKLYTPLTLLHFWMAGFFAFLLLRRFGLSIPAALAGGTIFMCCANMTSRFHYYPGINTMAWAPLMLYLVDRFHSLRSWQSLCGLSLVSAFTVLAGYQQFAIYLFYLSFGYSLFVSAPSCYRFDLKRGAVVAALLTGAGLGLLSFLVHLDLLALYAFGVLLAGTGFLAGGRGVLPWIRANLPVLCALLLGLGLAAVQLAPVIKLMGHSTRAILSPESMVTHNSLPGTGWLGFLFPMLMTDPLWIPSYSVKNFTGFALTGRINLNFVEDTIYVGVLPLALLACIRFKTGLHRAPRFLAGTCVLFLCLSFGLFLAVYPMWLIPGFQLDPRRTLIVTAFLFSLLAAFGFERIRQDASQRKRPLVIASLLLILAAASCVTGLFYSRALAELFLDQIKNSEIFLNASLSMEEIENLLKENGSQIRASLLHFALAAVLGGIALFFLALKPGRRAFIFVFVALLADLAPLSWHANRPQQPGGFLKLHPLITRMQTSSETDHFRIFRYTLEWESTHGTRVPLPPNLPTHFKIEDGQGYIVQTLKRYFKLADGIQPGIAPPGIWVKSLTTPRSIQSPLLDLIGVRYLLSTTEVPDTPGFEKIYEKNGIFLYENSQAFPRAFMVSRARFMQLDDPTPFAPSPVQEALLSPGMDLRREAVLETAPFELPQHDDPFPKAVVTYPAPEKVKILFDGFNPGGVLVLTDAFYPGWTARVDEEPMPVFPADLAFRGVRVPRGSKEVVFEYHPPEVKMGALISLISAALILGFSMLFLVVRIKNAPNP